MKLRVALAGLVALCIALAGPARAQGSVELQVTLPQGSPFPAAPQVGVRVIADPSVPRPLTVVLEVARQPGFSTIIYTDQVQGDEVSFRVVRLLAENATVYLRVRVVDGGGRQVAQQAFGPFTTGPRLELKRPLGPKGVVLFTPFPTFVWSSAPVALPPGPWLYDLRVTNVATGKDEVVARQLLDTTFTPVVGLQGNTAYRWSVVARVANGDPADSAVAVAPSSFVLSTTAAPVATLLYQNFPNPFPTSYSRTTCIWFDLKERGQVQLTVHTLRGELVRRLVPGPSIGALLAGGAYGRVGEGAFAGCDPRLEWDGRGDDGRVLPAGIYLLRFRADGYESVKKIVFRGE